MPEALRKTRYAELCSHATVGESTGDEKRLEKIWVKSRKEEILRWTWWRDGKMLPRPAEMNEPELIALIDRGFQAGVLSSFFLRQLIHLVEKRAESLVGEM